MNATVQPFLIMDFKSSEFAKPIELNMFDPGCTKLVARLATTKAVPQTKIGI